MRMFSISKAILLAVTSMCFCCTVSAEEKITIELISPDASVKEALGSSGVCHIIVRDGKIYRVCPFKVTPEVEFQIKALESK
jgi:hypothetical protein